MQAYMFFCSKNVDDNMLNVGWHVYARSLLSLLPFSMLKFCIILSDYFYSEMIKLPNVV